MIKIDGLIVVEPVRMSLPIHGMTLKPIVLVTTDPEKSKVASILKDGLLSTEGMIAAYMKPASDLIAKARRDEDARIVNQFISQGVKNE